MDCGDHRVFHDCRDQAIFHRRRGCDATRMTIHAAFAEELAGPQNCHHGFLAMLGQNSQLDLAFLNVKHRFRDIALLEQVLILVKFEDRFPSSDFGEKTLRIKLVNSWLSHRSLLLARRTSSILAGCSSNGGGRSKVIACGACPNRLTPDCRRFYRESAGNPSPERLSAGTNPPG